MLTDLPENKLTDAILGAAFEVHKVLGPGLKEGIDRVIRIPEQEAQIAETPAREARPKDSLRASASPGTPCFSVADTPSNL